MVRDDCRHYRGDKPCKHKRACQGCSHYDAVAERILVIKLGALGDLLRTTSLLPALRKAHPKARLTWVTAPECLPLLQNVPGIDEIWTTGTDLAARVMARQWDLVLNFDKEAPAPELATLAKAGEKRGFVIGPSNTLAAANAASAYALELGVDDELKFRRNTKTYPEIVHEMAELAIPSPAPRPMLVLTDDERARARQAIERAVPAGMAFPEGPLVGLHPGASARFATKRWHWDRYAAVAARLHQEKGAVPVLFGGREEEETLKKIESYLRRLDVPVLRAAPAEKERDPALRQSEELPLRVFCAAVAECDAIICGDTLALHVALALDVPTTAIFLSTCPQEIEDYGTAEKIIGRAACAPCYLAKCSQATQVCADSISVDEVVASVARKIGKPVRKKKAA